MISRLPTFQKRSPIIALNQAIRQNPDEAEGYGKKAAYYQERDVILAAMAQWTRVMELDPFDMEASDTLDQLEVALLKYRASTESTRVYEFLDTLGPESARQVYMATMQLYEKILSFTPDDSATRMEMEKLRDRFLQKSAVPGQDSKVITIAGIDVVNLFPSLMQSYRTNAVGSVTVQNSLDEPIQDLRASFYIRKYMDFPSEGASLTELGAGEVTDVDLLAILNEEVLLLQEDLPVQALVELRYKVGNTEHAVSKTKTLTLYRKTALSWDDSGKISSFIMPNEEIVSAFAHRVLRNPSTSTQGLTERFLRAATLCDALGTYGIEYIEDPESPFSAILGKAEIVDTVRFPRTTLQIGSGDCDDTTALLGSLLESAGIPTAVMTSPGHVFLAFDTGEPAENDWLYQTGEMEAIAHNGNVWIPVETTELEKGFDIAWKVASDLVRTHGNEVEFLPVSEQREHYPPLPLPESTMMIVEPQSDRVEEMLSLSIQNVTKFIYDDSVDQLEVKLEEASARRALKYRNQLGVLHARFGELDEARLALEKSISDSPEYLASYVNLANLHLVAGGPDAAESTLRAGIEQNPDSAILNLVLARVYHNQDETGLAKEHMDKVRASSPDLAARYDFIGSVGAESRAGIEEESTLFWVEGD